MYQGIAEQDIYDMIDDIKSRFKIDEDRMYPTGLSMGGGGTINQSIAHPDILAAVAPVCAGVSAENSIRQSDFNLSNLVLFGTRETNAVIAKFADRLPVHLNNDADDYGLVYIFPVNQHYVLVNSGLAWWTSSAEAAQGAMNFLANTARSESLSKTEDFLLFRGTNDNVIVTGKFDNNWNLPADAVNMMKSTNTVTVK
jgi:hypothetical protein